MLTVCVSETKLFRVYCRYATKHNCFTFSQTGQIVFTEKGFQNWKKAIEKFKIHERSLSYNETTTQWIVLGRPTVKSQLSSQTRDLQQTRRASLLCQLRGIRYLARQGIAIQGHTEFEGNLKQLLTWSHETSTLKVWIKDDRFTCHQTVNELIAIMGQNLLRNLLGK